MIVTPNSAAGRWPWLLASAALVACSAGSAPPRTSSGTFADSAAEADGSAPVDAATAADDVRTSGVDAHGASERGSGDQRLPRPDAGNDATPVRDSAADGPTGGQAKDGSATALDLGVEARNALPGGYNPCPPAGSPCRILPLGDSITAGAGSTDESGYRGPLFQRARRAGQAITYLGSQADGPPSLDAVPFPRAHEGHPGARIAQLSGRAASGAHIVLLMAGTNDMTDTDTVSGAPARLASLIDGILAAAPNALLVVAQIVPTRLDARNTLVETFKAALPEIVRTRAAAGKHIVLVDMYRAFAANPAYKTARLADDLHPNDAGFAAMADVWYQAVGATLR